jgi:hypothetical protein
VETLTGVSSVLVCLICISPSEQAAASAMTAPLASPKAIRMELSIATAKVRWTRFAVE